MPGEIELVKDALVEFRMDVLKALAEIDVEIDALHQAVISGGIVNADGLRELRATSRQKLHKFREYHAQHIASAHEPR